MILALCVPEMKHEQSLRKVNTMAISIEKSFIAFLFRTLLAEEFGSKKVMAEKLDIPLRTLQENYQCLDSAKGGTIAFERLILYCVQNEIDICSLYKRFVSTTRD